MHACLHALPPEEQQHLWPGCACFFMSLRGVPMPTHHTMDHPLFERRRRGYRIHSRCMLFVRSDQLDAEQWWSPWSSYLSSLQMVRASAGGFSLYNLQVCSSMQVSSGTVQHAGVQHAGLIRDCTPTERTALSYGHFSCTLGISRSFKCRSRNPESNSALSSLAPA